ncbi:hypothetical protein HMPREF1092_01316 [Clostridium thermobutyricum]|uniref:Uncharacterized protein n=1 Tax=Clostridium thermobutyricum TaxID=29372 RepID=N9WG74_9CLOT|nr:hypothetical protein HMPREF1092_01316 [Clostridium thermobutyricum]
MEGLTIFTLEEFIYIIKTISLQLEEEDYKFKLDIQKKLDNINFNIYLDILEKCEKIASNIETSNELNSLNNLHNYLIKNIKLYLKNYII